MISSIVKWKEEDFTLTLHLYYLSCYYWMVLTQIR